MHPGPKKSEGFTVFLPITAERTCVKRSAVVSMAVAYLREVGWGGVVTLLPFRALAAIKSVPPAKTSVNGRAVTVAGVSGDGPGIHRIN